MKAEELTPCAICGGPIIAGHHAGLFYRVTVEPFILDSEAACRRLGEELTMGPLAGVLGLQEDVAKTVKGAETRKLVCLSCVASRQPIAAVMVMEPD